MPVLLETVAEGIATLTLNRPDRLNALNAALRAALAEALRRADADPAVRVIVLTGAGRAFCAGLDLTELADHGPDVTAQVATTDFGLILAGLKTPAIAAINGPCVTGGFEIALACDMILAADSSYFCDTHVKVGLLPGWGLSQRLPRLIGPYRAKELSLTARRLPATEAAAWGLVNRVVPDADLLATAQHLARDIAAWPTANVAAIKDLIDNGYALPLSEALALERDQSRASNADSVPSPLR
ncbi:MAG: enoyl-CoA hydratase [Gemmobacter sp.]|nr:enoyl-CoA hydratase [Gemmobacter sp.]